MPKVPDFKKKNGSVDDTAGDTAGDTPDHNPEAAKTDSASVGLQPDDSTTTIETTSKQTKSGLPDNPEYDHIVNSDNTVIKSNEPPETPVDEQLEEVKADAEDAFKRQVAETEANNKESETATKEREAQHEAERETRGDNPDSQLPYVRGDDKEQQ